MGEHAVVVPAAQEDYGTRTRGGLDPRLKRALDRIPPHCRIASICTGSFDLAAAGLLAGRRAATHWKSCDRIRELYPDVGLDPDVL
ncbi:hypothetical protein [Streptomyces laculatispora]|uniref:hypothetical protein n=1 Tax=Streptomyces laculatispora TaxID=887464 RepID=UPI001A947481|nr:hypothetical protein [Streptomyces laculatispora]MBO0914518.1 hypothetical protein [Streptomyces laculatispora]